MEESSLTPGMKQYMDVKNANPDCIILFRMGDFYETFFEDAKLVARELEITLTSRGKDEKKAPLAGIPYHAIEPYIAKLVKKGYKVGIVEQTEDPKKAKGLVKRELIRIITPGTIVESSILEQNKNNYILGLFKENNNVAISFCDISTGEFFCADVFVDDFESELKRLNPSEIIFPSSLKDSFFIESLSKNNYLLNEFDDRFFYFEKSEDVLTKHFDVLNLEGFGIKSRSQIIACGALLSYLKETQRNSLSHINKISEYKMSDYMFLDSATIRNLELLSNIINKNEDSTLLSVIDRTNTPMGKRLIKKWLVSPLIKKQEIVRRLDCVGELNEKLIKRQEIVEELKEVYDLERLIGKVSYGNANPKDLISLGVSLKKIPHIKSLLEDMKSEFFVELANIPELYGAEELINKAIKEDPSITIREGNIIKESYNSELDELRDLTMDAKTYIAELEEKERERTNIKSLKIKYNKVIGYYIDVTKPNLSLVPEDYIRKQSQVNSERFVTEELKELESKILSAQERIYELEYDLFQEVIFKLGEYTKDIQDSARKLAVVDCIVSFSVVSQERGYVKPVFNEEGVFDLVYSRHPVIEVFSDVDFIPNDCKLSKNERTMIITGPNMAGKSTYLRQVALISVMAQIGCFVPARYANIPVVDRVFSRIGAYDDLVNQQSTFMVEMNETANIINNASENSLVIIDEIGRGTSTFDGVSLAWAIAEYINNVIKCKTLFATHYHHLNKMSDLFEGIVNYNVLVDESDEKIIFLRKIVKGGTDKSYGIQVAKLAGIPNEVIASAKEIMKKIEMGDNISENIITNTENNYIDSFNRVVEIKASDGSEEGFNKEERGVKNEEGEDDFNEVGRGWSEKMERDIGKRNEERVNTEEGMGVKSRGSNRVESEGGEEYRKSEGEEVNFKAEGKKVGSQGGEDFDEGEEDRKSEEEEVNFKAEGKKVGSQGGEEFNEGEEDRKSGEEEVNFKEEGKRIGSGEEENRETEENYEMKKEYDGGIKKKEFDEDFKEKKDFENTKIIKIDRSGFVENNENSKKINKLENEIHEIKGLLEKMFLEKKDEKKNRELKEFFK